MDCPDEYTLSRFIGGKLSAARQAAIDKHLQECSDCQRVLAWVKEESAGIDTAERETRAAGKKRATALKQLVKAFGRGDSIGRYIVVERIGHGAMGVVFSAYDPDLDRKVALKILRADILLGKSDAKASARLLREAQALARVVHPNVVGIFDVLKLSDDVVIAMEFVDGVNLATWLRQKPRSWREVLRAFVHAGRGLQAAHEASLVHRDFKPANVLVSKTGRVCVSDFGLAKGFGSDAADEPELDPLSAHSLSPRLLDLTLTGTGGFAGTPGYMAPEQLAGREADARSDQFAFCVALYEALFGDRPFSGKSVAELKLGILAGDIPPSRRTKRVPKWLRETIIRGLHPRPNRRFASMGELLGHLEHDRASKRKRQWAAFGVTALLAGAIFSTTLWMQANSPLCKGAEQKLVGVWDSAAKENVEAALLASGRPYAARTFEVVQKNLDAWAAEWIDHHTRACRATHFDGEQSEQTLDLRMGCLRQKRQSLKSLVGALTEKPHPRVVDEAVKASLELGRIDTCADVGSLAQQVRPPEDPAKRATVETIKARLADVEQRNRLGQYDAAQAILSALEPRIEALQYPPLRSELALMQGINFERRGKFARSEAALREALSMGLRWQQKEIARQAATILVFVVGHERKRHAEGLAFAETSLGLSKDLDDEREAAAVNNLGIIRWSQGDYKAAEVAFVRAIELYEKGLGPDHPRVARSHNNLGLVLHNRGRYEEAAARHREALALREKTLGPNHPRVGTSLNNLATVLTDLGDLSAAEAHIRRAIALREEALGAGHPHVATSMASLGLILWRNGEYEKAETAHRRGLAIRVKALGGDHPDVAHSKNHLGFVLYSQAAYEDAEQAFREALAINEQVLGSDHPELIWSLAGLGKVFWHTGEQGLATRFFSRVLSICGEKTCAVLPEAMAKFGMARLLGRQGGDRSRSQELATQAQQGFAKLHMKTESAAVAEWLRRR